MHRGLRIPHLRKGDDSPLRIWLLHWIRNACHTQRLPTPRRRRYGHNVTSPTRLRHSTAGWFTRSLRLCSRDARCVRAFSRGTCVEICDAVRLGNSYRIYSLKYIPYTHSTCRHLFLQGPANAGESSLALPLSRDREEDCDV